MERRKGLGDDVRCSAFAPPWSSHELQKDTLHYDSHHIQLTTIHDHFRTKARTHTPSSPQHSSDTSPSSTTMKGNAGQTKVHYKGKEDDFIIFVDSADAVKEWKKDSSVPLAQVVSGWKVFHTNK